MDEQLELIIQQIYAAALDASEWGPVLAAINLVIGAFAGCYAGLEVGLGRYSFRHTAGGDTPWGNLWNERCVVPSPVHAIPSAGDAPPTGTRHVLSGVASTQDGMISLLSFQRRLSQAPFSRADTDFVQRLIPHFAMADRLAAKVGALREDRRLAMTVLDKIDYGIIIVSATGQIHMRNRGAERWLASASVVQAHLGRIRLTVDKDNAALEQLIAAAGADIDRDAGAVDTVGVTDGMRAKILVMPIEHDAQAHPNDGRARVALICTDIDQQRAMAPRLLQRTYGLTPAEVKVATGLANGKAPDELAESLFVSLPTIKTHTQHIYQKVGVSRQTELVRLVYGLPPLS
nr:helix-turn-helix transcriptional regulator [uncultured Duganella sp.]